MKYSVSRNNKNEKITISTKQTENGYEAQYHYVNKKDIFYKEYKSNVFTGKNEYDAISNLIYFANFELTKSNVINVAELLNKAWNLFFNCYQPILDNIGIENPVLKKCMEQ